MNPPHFKAQSARCARADTPRPARKSGKTRLDATSVSPDAGDAPPAALEMPPPPPRAFVNARHGIDAHDGNRKGTRAPKIAEENVGRFLDVLRWWPSIDASAGDARKRMPWTEVFNFIRIKKR